MRIVLLWFAILVLPASDPCSVVAGEAAAADLKNAPHKGPPSALVAKTPEERRVLEMRRNDQRALARRKFDWQRFEDALTAAERAAELTRTLEGSDSAPLAEDRRYVVSILMALSRFDEAAQVMHEVVDIRKTRNGGGPGLLVEASEYLRCIQRVRELSPSDLAVLRDSTKATAEAQRRQRLGHPDEAIRVADAGLAKRKAVLGYADKVYLDELGVQALRLLDAGQPDRASSCIQQTLEGYRALFGDRHRWYASALNAASLVPYKTGNHQRVIDLRKRATDIYLASCGPKHPVTRQSVELLAEAYREQAGRFQSQGNFAQAAAQFEQEAQLWTSIYGGDHWHAREAQVMRRYLLRVNGLTSQGQGPIDAVVKAKDKAVECLRAGSFDAAIAPARSAHAGSARLLGEDAPQTLNCLELLAVAEAKKGDIASADRSYRLLWKLRRTALGTDHPQTLDALQSLLDLWEAQAVRQREGGDLAAAEASLTIARKLAEEGYGKDDWRTTDFRLDVKHLQRLRELSADQRHQLAEAQARYHESTQLKRDGRPAQAIRPMLRALAIRRELLGPSDGVAACLHGLGDLYRTIGAYPAAQRYTQEALQLRARLLGRTHPKYAQTLANWAALLSDLQEYSPAIDAFQQAQDVFQRTPSNRGIDYAHAANGLAMAYMMGFHNLAQAEPLLQEALEVCAKPEFPDRSLHARVLHNLAGLYSRMGREAEAQQLFQQAADTWRKLGEQVDYAKAIDSLATLHLNHRDFRGAERLQTEAREIFRDYLGPQHPDTLLAIANLASTKLASGHVHEALDLQRDALPTAERNVQLATALASEEQELRLVAALRRHLDSLIDLLAPDRRCDEEAYLAVLRWKGRVLLRQRWQRIARALPEFQPQVEQLRVLNARLADLTFTPPHPDDRPKWQRQLAALNAERQETEKTLRAALGERPYLAEAPGAVLARIRGPLDSKTALIDFLGYYHATPIDRDGRVDWQGEMRLAAFILRVDRPVTRIEFGPTEPIVLAIRQWRQCYGAPGWPRDDQGVAARLRRMLWEPLESKLDGIAVVAISPDGPLAQIPFAALPGRCKGTYLLEDYAFAQLPTPQLLAELPAASPAGRKESPRAPGLLLVGDVDFGLKPAESQTGGLAVTFSALPGTRSEIDRIAGLYREQFGDRNLVIKSGDRASKTAVRQDLAGKQFVHLATHGFYGYLGSRADQLALADMTRGLTFAAEPAAVLVDEPSEETLVHPGLLSGIALAGANRTGSGSSVGLSDGVLTATEVADLDLRNVRLVVLSACESALGNLQSGEGMIGLQRALHVAGARTAVTTLWKVADAPTQALMVRFYGRLWRPLDVAPLTALRDAQLWLARDACRDPALVRALTLRPLEGRERLPPFYWAPFVLSGDWR